MYIQAMRQPKFSGVHSLSTGWKDDRRKILFFVWELPDGASSFPTIFFLAS